VILNLFRSAGWSGRWISTYGSPLTHPRFLSSWRWNDLHAQVHEPVTDVHVLELLESVARQNGGTYSGCWDVLVWRGEGLIFAESKRAGHDRLRLNQRTWFCSAIAAGLGLSDFLVVEWQLA
jgi:hypothetical protein